MDCVDMMCSALHPLGPSICLPVVDQTVSPSLLQCSVRCSLCTVECSVILATCSPPQLQLDVSPKWPPVPNMMCSSQCPVNQAIRAAWLIV